MMSALLAIAAFLLTVPVKTAILALQVSKVGRGISERIARNSEGGVVRRKAAAIAEAGLRLVLGFLRALGVACVALAAFSALAVSVAALFLASAVSSAFGAIEAVGLSNPSGGVYGEAEVQPAGGSSDSGLEAYCRLLGEWYIANVPTYQGRTDNVATNSRTYYDCPIINGKAGDDCSGFAAVYASLVSGHKVAAKSTQTMYDGCSEYANAGWQWLKIEDIGGVGGLLAGDIMVANSSADPGSKGHHAEIYLSPSTTWGWGAVYSSYPRSNTLTEEEHGGRLYVCDNSHRYGGVYRYGGVSK